MGNVRTCDQTRTTAVNAVKSAPSTTRRVPLASAVNVMPSLALLASLSHPVLAPRLSILPPTSTTAVLSVTGVLLPSRTVSDRSARILSVNRRAVNQVTLSITEVHLAAIC